MKELELRLILAAAMLIGIFIVLAVVALFINVTVKIGLHFKLLWLQIAAIFIGICIGVCGMLVVDNCVYNDLERKLLERKLYAAEQEGYVFYIDGVNTMPQDIPFAQCTLHNTAIKEKDHEVHIASHLSNDQKWEIGDIYEEVYVDGVPVDKDHVTLGLYEDDQIIYNEDKQIVYVYTGGN